MTHSCMLGVDTARRSELIAARMTVEQTRDYLEADSLGYLSLDRLLASVDLPQSTLCTACFTGDYPVTVQLELDKTALERGGTPNGKDAPTGSRGRHAPGNQP